MSVAICTRCRTVQPLEARCMICGAELGAALPTAAKPHVQASWRITEDPRTTNRISAIGLVGAIAVAVLIVVTRSNSLWMVAAAVTALLLFVGPLLIGVPTRLRKTKMTIELAPTDDGQLEVGETHRAEPIGEVEELIIGEELHSQQGLLVRRSLEHARPLQNNASERALRAIALGRKNYLFVGNEEAGKRVATLYSLVASCILNGVNPQAYLADVLLRVQSHPHADIDAILPNAWQPAA